MTPLIRLNYCSKKELLTLTGIGAKKASSILDHRKRFGYFLSIDDFASVDGITTRLVDNLIDQLDWSFDGNYVDPPNILGGDARDLYLVAPNSVDLIITSPYWKKRDYCITETKLESEHGTRLLHI